MKLIYSKVSCKTAIASLCGLLLLLAGPKLFAAPKLKIIVGPAQFKTWETALGPADIAGGAAGADFAAEYESAADLVLIEVANSTNIWEVSVQKADVLWNANITVFARRSSEGTSTDPGAYIEFGGAYQPVTGTDTRLFRGFGDYADVGIQLKVSGSYATFGVDAGSYTTELTYTVIDGL